MKKGYNRKPEAWWKANQVVTLRSIANQFNVIPPGTVCKVTRKWSGLTIETYPCQRCHVVTSVSRVGYDKLELVSDVYLEGLGCAKMRCDMDASFLEKEHIVIRHKKGYLVLPISRKDFGDRHVAWFCGPGDWKIHAAGADTEL